MPEAPSASSSALYWVPKAQRQRLSEQLLAPGAQALLQKHGVVELSAEQAQKLHLWGATQIEPLRPRKLNQIAPHNVAAQDTSNVDEIVPGGSSGYDLTGLGVRIGEWDGGAVRETHVELVGRVEMVDSAPLSDHATHVAGTMIASGQLAEARGMATAARLRAFDFYGDLSEMLVEGPNVAVSNHSYGLRRGFESGVCPAPTWYGGAGELEDPTNGKYTLFSRTIDAVIETTDQLSVWSAGNDRNDPGPAQGQPHYHAGDCNTQHFDPHHAEIDLQYDLLGPTAVAKNNVVVAAVLDATSDPWGQVTPASFSSFGPPDDGRIKPDLAANGVGLLSPVATSDQGYGRYSGTSMAAPTVTGAAALLVEHYRRKHGLDPSSALLKAIMIHAAHDVDAPGPDYRMGHGLLDARAAADLIESSGPGGPTLIEGVYDGAALVFNVSGSADQAMRFSLVWTDPPGPNNQAGTDESTPALVHDLELEVSSPAGQRFWPWSLNLAMPSADATALGPNAVDNVEVVDVPAAQNVAGVWTVRVAAQGSLSSPQRFALVSSASLSAVSALGPRLGALKQIEANAQQAGPPVQALAPLRNLGGGNLSWQAQSLSSWITIAQAAGSAPSDLVLSIEPASLTPGLHFGEVLISSNDPAPDHRLSVALMVAPGECSTDEDCDRPGSCQSAQGATCVQLNCVYPNAPEGSQCDDGDACTLSDTCSQGQCAPGPALVCPAPASCRQPGVCQPDTGACTYDQSPDGAACDDGAFCTVDDVCAAGTCAGQPRVCEDRTCLRGSCDEAEDRCRLLPEPIGTECGATARCDQGVRHEADACDGAGKCQPGDQQSCAPYSGCESALVCARSCQGDADCAPDYQCLGNECRTNTAPIARVQAPEAVGEGEQVLLSATASTDAEQDELQYSWTQHFGPSVELQAQSSSVARFVAPSVVESTALGFELRVQGPFGLEDAVRFEVRVDNTVNEPPIAHAGDDLTVRAGERFTLDATRSEDPNAEPLQYLWVQSEGPVVHLDDPQSARPSAIAPPQAAILGFRLVVRDGEGQGQDAVHVRVQDELQNGLDAGGNSDAGPSVDAGSADGGTEDAGGDKPTSAFGCVCASEQSTGPRIAWFGLLGLSLLLLRRRKRVLA